MAKILVIDDESTMLQMISAFLQAFGHRIITATDVSTANTALTSEPDLELILCDVSLKHESGTAVHKTFLQHSLLPAHRFFFMTGWAPPEDMVYIEQTKSQLINKPFTLPALRARLESALIP